MDVDLINKIREAVEKGKEIRSVYYSSIELEDEQELGSPASQTKLALLEAKYGKGLPPSYRCFLALYDGWSMVDGAMDLLSIDEMLGGQREEDIEEWQRQEREAGDTVAADSIVIGLSEVTPTKLLLDPGRINSLGEWSVIQHHKGEEADYPSFLIWLEESIDEFGELIDEELNGSE